MTQQEPELYYKAHLEQYQQEVKHLQKRIALLSLLRIILFLVAVALIYLFYPHWKTLVPTILVSVVAFVYLLSKHTDAKAKRAFYKALAASNAEELKIAAKQFHHRAAGEEFQDPTHNYSLDIDIFGRGSFFQYINRTATKAGTQELADALKANAILDIEKRQEAIKELASKPEWRQFYAAHASLVKVETPARFIVDWVSTYKPFLPKVMAYFPQVFTLITGLIFGAIYFEISGSQTLLVSWLLLGLGLTGGYVKSINKLAANSDKVKDTFRQYAVLLDRIENETFKSQLLQEKQQRIQLDALKASQIFKQLSKALDALDNRNNIIGAIFGNGFFLNDIKNSYKIERWIATYGIKIAHWFEVVSFFDAYNTLGNFSFNHPNFIYPELVAEGDVIKATHLGHPMLDAQKRVDSHVTITNEQFFIVTGANMAGKSTFLRTIALHIVMANMGLPVCASSSQYHPMKLITSMRTSDSLTDDSSYFFSELTRLKYIVDAIAKTPYFIVLDEILKGTNSTDKAIGSRKFVEKLVASHATGIIATHDLSLCEMATELEAVENYYFDAEIVNDELYFDYTLKKGICQNMNASFLLKKMEII